MQLFCHRFFVFLDKKSATKKLQNNLKIILTFLFILMSEKTTKPKPKVQPTAPQPNENVTSPMLKHFKEMYIDNNYGFCENELYDSVSQLVNFFEKLHSIDIDIQLKRLKPADMSKYEKPSDYTPVFNGTSHVILGTFEFIHLMSKDELTEIKGIINDFIKHKEEVNSAYHIAKKAIPEQYKQFLLFQKSQASRNFQQIKKEIQFSSIGSTFIERELSTMSYREHILAEFIDSPCTDEFGIPYYL